MLRGNDGLTPRTSTLADESYLDFVESFRMIAGYGVYPKVAAVGDKLVEEQLGSLDSDLDLGAVNEVFNTTAIAKTWQRVMRTHQEMNWRRVRDTFAPFQDQILQDMEDARTAGPGKLVMDPQFVTPDYAREEIHLMPGGYTDHPLAGIIYHYGTKVFYTGMNDQDEVHVELAQTMTPPEGKCEKILDIGCSIGQATMQLKDRFPDAEIWGLEVGEPMVKYAHYLATQRKIDVNFIQALAEDMPFEDGEFDAVLAYIIFHEVPVHTISEIVNDVFRVLRPGGTFSVFEFPSASQNLPPSQRFMIDYDSKNNCEPYSPGFVYADFHKIIKDAGFTIEQGPKNSNPFLQTLVCTKPA
ncbi:MAG: class I SAM-dependent methyltransferase [Pseudomonadota bacterium]